MAMGTLILVQESLVVFAETRKGLGDNRAVTKTIDGLVPKLKSEYGRRPTEDEITRAMAEANHKHVRIRMMISATVEYPSKEIPRVANGFPTPQVSNRLLSLKGPTRSTSVCASDW
jgi:hypothetical protein